MSIFKLLGSTLILVVAGALSACDQNDGAAEKAGESVDRAVEEAKDTVKDATN
tara:strand:+ start:77 stop:235 length:159 start_codon:yes stop_codon:yes gene_type:complete